MMKPTRYTINLAIYSCPLDIWIGEHSYKAFEKVCKKAGCKDSTKTSTTVGLSYGGNIWVKDLELTPESLGNFAHELRHFVNNLIEGRGMQGEDESLSYITGYITERVYKRALKK